MKRTLIIASLVFITVFTSCKFDQTIAGTYIGTYTCSDTWDSLPVPNGNGTITITEASPNRVNVLFTSAGNPDVQMNNLIVKHSSLQYDYFTIEEGSNYQYYIEGSYYPDHELHFDVRDPAFLTPWDTEIIFTGTKQ